MWQGNTGAPRPWNGRTRCKASNQSQFRSPPRLARLLLHQYLRRTTKQIITAFWEMKRYIEAC